MDRQEAKFRSDFYRKSYFKILRWLMIVSVLILVLILAIIYFVFTEPSPSYYATTSNGQILPLIGK